MHGILATGYHYLHYILSLIDVDAAFLHYFSVVIVSKIYHQRSKQRSDEAILSSLLGKDPDDLYAKFVGDQIGKSCYIHIYYDTIMANDICRAAES